MRVERRDGPTPAGGAYSEAHFDDDGRVVEIVEYDDAGEAISRTYADPSQPHVESLVYRFVPVESERFSAIFENVPAVEHESPAFKVTLDNAVATFEMREHHASTESARAAVEPFLRAWEISDTLRAGRPEFRFDFERAEVAERSPGLDPPTGAATHVHHFGHIEAGIVLEGSVSLSVRRGTYPAPPATFVLTPDVETLWARWNGYTDGKEPLRTMAYFCLTVLQMQGGRPGAATHYGISSKVLTTLARLSTETGDERTARKLSAKLRPATSEERSWLEATVKALICRVGEVAAVGSASSLPKLTLGDLPDL